MKTIVIVEGSSDTNKLRTIWPDIVTVETSGHGLSQKIINLIVLLSKTHKMIVFTDPDKPGLDIRKKINEILSNNCFNVFLPQRPLNHKGKWGVAEAPAKEIMAAFKEQKKFSSANSSLSLQDYLSIVETKNIRETICEKLNINFFNNKTLFKVLNSLNYNKDSLLKLLKEDNEI